MSTRYFATDLGLASVSWNEHGLTRLHLPEKKAEPLQTLTGPHEIEELITRLRDHFRGKVHDFHEVRLDWSQVTGFQRRVYEAARQVAAGQTCTYGEVAHQLKLGPGGARAVGVALGANPWPLIVPCHRVVAADGRMTGFSAPGGIRTKARLLALEGALLLAE